MNTGLLARARIGLYYVVSILILVLLAILVGEVYLRIFQANSKQRTHSNKAEYDKELGWVPKHNFTLNENHRDLNGNKYNVDYTTEQYGFRRFGNPNTGLKTILFIGDSYTQAVEVETKDAYYSIIKENLDVEVFAFGMAGYGTTQEYLVLDKYLDEINPDLVILQTCDNDFIDNYVELEKISNYRVGLRRPYFNLDGKLIYETPISRIQAILEKSRFLALFFQKYKLNVGKKDSNPAEHYIAHLKKEYQPYATSVQLTELALMKIKKRLNGIPFFIFSASRFEPQLSDFRQLAENHNIQFVSATAENIHLAKKEKVVTSIDKFHWVASGHEVVAETLIPFIKSAIDD